MTRATASRPGSRAFACRALAALCLSVTSLSGCHIIAGFEGLELREDPEPLWSTSLSGEQLQTTRAVAASPGQVYALVEHRGELTLPDTVLPPGGEDDVALIRFGEQGRTEWVRAIASSGSEFGRTLVAGDDGVVAAGVFSGSLDVAGFPLAGEGPQSIYLAAIGADGSVSWARHFDGPGFAVPNAKLALARDPQGQLLLGGAFQGEVDFGCGTLVAQGPVDAFIAKLDEQGCVWSKALGDSKLQQIESVGVELGGDVVVAGKFAGTLDFGGGVLLSSGGGIDAFVAKLDADGNHRWSHRYGDSGAAVSSVQVAVHRLGNVTMGCYFQGTVDFGNGSFIARQGHDLGVLKLNPNGELLWTRHFPTNRSACSLDDCELDRIGVVTDIDGNLVLTGHFRGEMDFGGTELVSIGDTDLFIAKLDVNGHLLWSGRYGNVSAQCEPPDCVAVANVDSDRNIVLGGHYLGRMDFGQGTFPTDEDGGAFVVKLAP